jgi:ABC-type multidrug transport system fused ATPase/permease subunit
MDYVIHINNDGTQQGCLTSQEFFQSANIDLLSDIR